MEEMARAVSGLAGAIAREEDPREAAELVERTAEAWKRDAANRGEPGEGRGARQAAAVLRELGHAATQVETGRPWSQGMTAALDGMAARARACREDAP